MERETLQQELFLQVKKEKKIWGEIEEWSFKEEEII